MTRETDLELQAPSKETPASNITEQPSSTQQSADLSDDEEPQELSTTRFLIKSAVHIILSTLGGMAAAAAGARHDHSPFTPLTMRAGAFAGALTAFIIAFSQLIIKNASSIFLTLPIMVVASSFGTAALVTLAVLQYLGLEERQELLIGAVAAGAPLMCGLYLTARAGVFWDVTSIGWDALAGYTFLRVSENHGLFICRPATGAAAGAVYGIFVFLSNLIAANFINEKVEGEKGGFLYSKTYSTW